MVQSKPGQQSPTTGLLIARVVGTSNTPTLLKTVTYYRIAVQRANASWFVSRRFREFAMMHATLSRECKDLPPLPKKMVRSTPKALSDRYVELDAFLRSLLAMPAASSLPQIRAFLGVDAGGADNAVGSSAPSPSSVILVAQLTPQPGCVVDINTLSLTYTGSSSPASPHAPAGASAASSSKEEAAAASAAHANGEQLALQLLDSANRVSGHVSRWLGQAREDAAATAEKARARLSAAQQTLREDVNRKLERDEHARQRVEDAKRAVASAQEKIFGPSIDGS